MCHRNSSITPVSRLACLANRLRVSCIILLYFFFFSSLTFQLLLSSSSLLLLSPACPAQARSPLESSVPCLATRTLGDDIRVQRSPSVGWLSKSGAGRGRAGWGRGEEEEQRVPPNACCRVNSGKAANASLAEWLLLRVPMLPPPPPPRCSVSLLVCFLPSIWDAAGRSPLRSRLGTGLSSLEVSCGCSKGCLHFAHQHGVTNAPSFNILISI